MIYTFSGIDSSGKTTQINLLVKYLLGKNISCYCKWGKGRATPIVMIIKKMFRRDGKMSFEGKKEYRKKFYKNKYKKYFLLILSIIDLWWYWGIYYRYLHMKYGILICDRYIWDTYIEFKIDFDEFNIDSWLIWNVAILFAPKPKHSMVFTISAEESFRRDCEKGDRDPDAIIKKELKIEKYYELIEKNKWDTVIDGKQTKDEIFNIIEKRMFYDDTGNV